MMLRIVQNIVGEVMYPLKCPFAMNPTRVVVHNTANDASAYNEIRYMHRNNAEVSFHYAVDDLGAVQGLPLDRNAWHAGDGGSGVGNREGIGVEICYSKSGGERFAKAQENAAELCAYLLHEYGWGFDLSRITKHEDYADKHCPHRTLDDYGWDYFLDLVKTKYEALYPEDVPMTKEEKKAMEEQFAAYEKKLTAYEKRIAKLEKDAEATKVSINWNAHIGGDVGGAEAKAMMNDLVKHGDFKGTNAAGYYGLSKQMMRILLIIYRLIKRLIKLNGLKWS